MGHPSLHLQGVQSVIFSHCAVAEVRPVVVVVLLPVGACAPWLMFKV